VFYPGAGETALRVPAGPFHTKQNAPAFDRDVFADSADLKEIPQELVVDLVVELDFLRFDESA
jgi:hypothetical protein